MSLYNGLMSTYWSESAALAPTCIALPASAEDVSAIIKIVSDNECKFGVRGGGHGAFPGSNSIRNGVTIDFSK
jgi:FAD/FMN-containing dehydrogenase